MDFVPGALVAGRYRLRRMVGAGGMGEVWAGEDAKTGSRVAVKHLLPTAAKHHEVVVRFKREAYLLGKIQSEFVARVVDFFDDEAYGLVLVMEFIDGPSLAHVLEDRTLSVEESVELAADLLQALRDLHSAKVVHRDLKPGNIIMRPGPTGRPRAVVVDFGISRLLPDKGENEVTGITRANIALGTVEYMAPEQILNSRDVTPVTDLYAVGIILWRALKGHHAFGDRRGEELARAKLIEEAPPLETGRRDELAQGLSRIVARALKKKPSQRYPSAVDMLAEVEGLRRFLSKVPGRPSSWSSADGIDIEDSTTDSGETAVRRSPLLDVAPAPAPEPPKLERPAPRVISQPRPAAGAPAKAPPPPAPSNPDVRASAPPAPAPSNPGAVIPRGSLPSIPEAVAIGDAPETRPRLPVARGSLPSIPESGAPDAARGGSIPDDVPRNPRASMQSFSDIGPPPIPAPAPSQAPAPVSNPASAAIPDGLTVPKRDSDPAAGRGSALSRGTVALAVLTAFAVGTAAGLVLAPNSVPPATASSGCAGCPSATTTPSVCASATSTQTTTEPTTTATTTTASASDAHPSASEERSVSARPALTGRLPTAATTTMSRTDDGLGEDPPKKPTASAQPTAPSTAATAPSTAATAPTTQPAPTPKTAPTEAAP